MKYSDIPAAQSVVFHCKARGIENIIISPGSRNAPLIIGFTEDPFFKCFSLVDERCAAFFALGIAQQLGKPTAVVSTSGSALLNYYPAVAEAFYSDIPLVVISADRPVYKIDIGDGQTIRQVNVFDKHVGFSANLKQDIRVNETENEAVDPSQQEVQSYNDHQLNSALNTAVVDRCPVHINVPFEEPLYTTVNKITIAPEVQQAAQVTEAVEVDYDHLATIWNSAKRKMILVGTSPPNAIAQRILDTLALDDSILVFTETTSNLHHPKFFASIDSIIAPIEKSPDRETLFEKLQPEILLTFGGMIVSKKIKAFLRNYRPKHHWHLDPKKAYDTFFSLTHHFRLEANNFLNDFLKHTRPVETHYYREWSAKKTHYIAMRQQYLKEIPFSDMVVFQTIQKTIPMAYQVQLANSSTVRYAQLFDMDASLKVYCNRGTSGIDGSSSTAIGASIYCETPTLLLSGDLSFFYDSNAFWNNYIRPDFRVIVINNGGGGIFRILPGKEDSANFEKYFETVQDLEIEKMCSLFRLSYSKAEDETELNTMLSTFYKPSEQAKLLEVKTPRLKNDKILLTYFDFIS